VTRHDRYCQLQPLDAITTPGTRGLLPDGANGGGMTLGVHRGDQGASGRAAMRRFSGAGRPTPR
jgi:hypothetical protein